MAYVVKMGLRSTLPTWSRVDDYVDVSMIKNDGDYFDARLNERMYKEAMFLIEASNRLSEDLLLWVRDNLEVLTDLAFQAGVNN